MTEERRLHPPPDRTALARAARRPLPRAARIAILGAGCAGLTCADELRALGYENTTLFEARARAMLWCIMPTREPYMAHMTRPLAEVWPARIGAMR